MELVRLNDIQKSRLLRLYSEQFNWDEINRYFQYMKKDKIKDQNELVEFVEENGNAIFNHLRYALRYGVEWNSSENKCTYPLIADELRTENMVYRYVWLYANDNTLRVLHKGKVWYESEETSRRAGRLCRPRIDYPESELSHVFLSVEGMPICTDELFCHQECNNFSRQFDYYRHCICLPDVDIENENVTDGNKDNDQKTYKKQLKSEEIKKVNSSDGIRIEEYVYNRDYKEKMPTKKTKLKWSSCWK